MVLGTSTPAALVPPSGSTTEQVNMYCPGNGFVGVTHITNTTKTTATGSLKVTSKSTLPLTVTVVVQNRGGTSVYYWSHYTLSFA